MKRLIDEITGIIRETGFEGLDDFPMLYTAATAEDRRLEAVLEMYLEKPDETIGRQLFEELSAYITLDDINMGLMARAAKALLDGGFASR
ncbi:MAG: hypothetical protein IJM17_01530 [Firmicutes bacterium]|nr:hypothetical protein [Bacillota bacterium]